MRIEQLPAARIEYIGCRPVLNFEGEVLPIEDSGGLLPVRLEAGGQIIVVVCREHDRHVGIAVSHVLDVAAGGDLVEAGTGLRTQGVTLLNSRVTGVLDLGGIAPLGTSEAAPEPWMELAGRAG